jgi:short-subunit dehydrogenase
MKHICVITGAGSGMGMATARLIEQDNYVILVGRTLSKLEETLQELRGAGIQGETYACDISRPRLGQFTYQSSRELGEI